MINLQNAHPNKWSYIPLNNLVPFIDNFFISKDKIIQEINKIIQKGHSTDAPEVIFDTKTGYHLVIGGLTSYYAHTEITRKNKLILCKPCHGFRKRKLYLHTLNGLKKSSITTSHTRNEVIPKLTGHFEYTETDWQLF